MKHNLIFLLVALITTMFVGCKPKNMDVDDALKQLTEETLTKTPSRSYFALKGNDLRIVEYTFDGAAKVAVRKELNFIQASPYTGVRRDDYTYTWGEWCQGMLGRNILLNSATDARILLFLNDQFNDGDIVTAISEPRADFAANMIDGLTAGSWVGIDSTNVLELYWVDTTVYEYKTVKKKVICDTIFKRMPRPNYYVNKGIDSCTFYTYEFGKAAPGKEAKLTTHFLRNIVKSDTTFLPKHQNPAQMDTIVKYTVIPGTKVLRSVTDYTYWTIAAITLKDNVPSMDIVVGESEQTPVKLPMSTYSYDKTKGSFELGGLIYHFTPKK